MAKNSAKPIIAVENLDKHFGTVHAVNHLSFSVKPGELFAFLGVNGAGKSTTINIMCGQLKKDKGKVCISGHDLDHNPTAIKHIIGIVFQDSLLDKPLSVRANLRCRAALYGITGAAFKHRLADIASLLEFEDLLDRKLGELSGGQRRRIDIARALLHRPKILILDEPTTGLDPKTRQNIWAVLHNLRQKQGLTVFLTTHYMEEAAQSDQVVIINHGEIIASGTPLQLKNRFSHDAVNIYQAPEEAIRALGLPYTAINGGFSVAVKNTAAVTALILKHPQLFQDYEVVKGSMDDVFLAVTGQSLNVEKK